MFIIQFYIAILLGISVMINSEYTSTIEINSGPVRGEILSTVRQKIKYAAFKGIPYAEVPRNYLRFKPPVEKKNWTDVFNATQDGNLCPQIDFITSNFTGSEDCLVINVYTPYTKFDRFKQSDLKAVMVWIHGGGFILGTSKSKLYGPDFLIENDVVVVTFNYRLGPFGFLNLNHNNATGNAGLKDQNLALIWVNKNVAKFGGNPKKITIFGQSSGAVSVDLHVLSDMSKGLFSQSIAMSGSPLCLYWSFESIEQAEILAFNLGEKLGTFTKSKDELLQTLYAASAEDIVLKSNELFFLPFRPTVESPFVARNEEKFLTSCPLDKYRLGRYNKYPHMVGFTTNEIKSITEVILFSLMRDKQDSFMNITRKIDNTLQYIIGNYSTKLSQAGLRKFVSWASDLFFVTGIDAKQKLMNTHNGHPIYYYRFAFESGPYFIVQNKTYDYISGVGHAEDLPYLFWISNGSLPLDDPEVQLIVDKYCRLMTNFAKFGNPTPNGDSDPLLRITWPNSGILGKHLEINSNLTIGSRPISHGVKLNELAGIGFTYSTTSCL